MLKVKSLLTGSILQAVYDWFLENNFSDILIVVHTKLAPDLHKTVLNHAKEDHTITLNIHPRCTRNFQISEEHVFFNVTMNGIGVSIKLPLYAVLGVVTPVDNGTSAFFEMPLVDRYLKAAEIRAALEDSTSTETVDRKLEVSTVDNVITVNYNNNVNTTSDEAQ
ncbi:ClpXP protease specificity-enhancing factor SspB, partial [Pseudomonas aeruginosa]|uniref:ClpXP protease specificity-enhancing factor SspB n=1 Tax=Pseudomonas aeruginosa TaxID=287 RepID=UPI001CA35B39